MAAPQITDIVADVDELLALSHAQLGRRVLRFLIDQQGHRSDQLSSSTRLSDFHFGHVRTDRAPRKDEVERAWRESWAWLHRELILINRDVGHDYSMLSRQGFSFVAARDDTAAFGRRIERGTVHFSLQETALHSFWRQSFDTAIFESFKEVEIAVRRAGRFGDSVLGVDLMRKAFHPESGPLTDSGSHLAEREALAALFAGAIGTFKNPNSHRDVSNDANTAADAIAFASYLLRVVDSRKVT